MTKFIIYHNDREVIITTPKHEADTIKEWFVEGGRNILEYDKDEVDTKAMRITNRTRVEW